MPIGVRCPAFPPEEDQDQRGSSPVEGEDDEERGEREFLESVARFGNVMVAHRRRRGKLSRSAGMGIRHTILPLDSDRNVYPMGEANILPNIEERELKRYDECHNFVVHVVVCFWFL